MSLVALRQAMTAKIRATLPGFAQVITHGGRFSADDLRRYSVKAPCAVVGVIGIRGARFESAPVVIDVHWGVFIVAKDESQVQRDAVALGLVEPLLRLVGAGERWDDDAAHLPTNLVAENLFGAEVDKQGIALWAAHWRQEYDLEPTVTFSSLDDFLTYHSITSPEGADDDAPVGEDTVTLEAP